MKPKTPLFPFWARHLRLGWYAGQIRVKSGDGLNEPKCCSTHSFVWYGGGDGHLDRCGDAFLVLKLSSAQLIIERTPYATRLENAKTSGAAQQNTSMTWAVMRSIGRRFATCVK